MTSPELTHAHSYEHYANTYAPPAIQGDFKGKHIVTVEQFSKQDLQILMEAAASIKQRFIENDRGLLDIAAGKIMASMFFEASTRTDMSFQAAMRRLGGSVVAASNGVQFSSVYKGENLADTVRAASCYADIVVLRHPEKGSSYLAAYYLDKLRDKISTGSALISGGDGIGEHPTQALLDLFTIFDFKGSVDDLTITMVGDLRFGRTVHSLAKLLAQIDAQQTTVCLVSPTALQMPEEIIDVMVEKGITIHATTNLNEVLGSSDVIYWTRVQEERFPNPEAYAAIRDAFIMTKPVLDAAKPDTILMHPLPRKHEMGSPHDHDILDADPRAIYFQQMENGMFVRMALLAKVLGVGKV